MCKAAESGWFYFVKRSANRKSPCAVCASASKPVTPLSLEAVVTVVCGCRDARHRKTRGGEGKGKIGGRGKKSPRRCRKPLEMLRDADLWT